MIIKAEGKENKYIITDVRDKQNVEDMKNICHSYKRINVLICNRETSRLFGMHFLNPVPITINNKIEDNVFFLNNMR